MTPHPEGGVGCVRLSDILLKILVKSACNF
nr:MAG TPA: ErfK/YbiS/YcfS/YnhG family protein [Caudoviricetes sp.]